MSWSVDHIEAVRWLVPLLAAAGACSDTAAGAGEPPVIVSVEPAAASFRAPAQVTLRGSGLVRELEVRFGDTKAAVVAASGDRLSVEIPSPGRPVRAPLRVSGASGSALWDHPFVFHAMAPEEMHFVARPPLPVVPAVVEAADLDGDGRPEWIVSTAEKVHVLAASADGVESVAESGPGARALAAATLPRLGRVVLALGAESLDLLVFKDKTLTRTVVEGAANPVAMTVLHGADGDRAWVVVPSETGAVVGRVKGTAEVHAVERVFDAGSFAVVSIAAGDLDGDGTADLVLGGASQGPRALLGDANGAFRDAPLGTLPGTVAGSVRFADLDADGAPDLVVAAADGDRAWRSVAGRFADRTAAFFGRTGARAAFESDLDGDAAMDRVGGAGLSLLRNDGTGRFFDYTPKAAPRFAAALPLLAADLDGDGDADLVVRDADGARVLENWAPGAFADTDGDGVPDDSDNCPRTANPDQADRDAHPFSCADAECASETGCKLSATAAHAYLACKGPASFSVARSFCRSRGARLALPISEEEAQAVAAAMGAPGWIDLSDEGHEGQFTDSTGSEAPFTSWHSGEPNNSSGNENCAQTYPDATWNDAPCGTLLAFACQEPPARTGDALGDSCDTCPLVPDPEQADADGNGTGDACEVEP